MIASSKKWTLALGAALAGAALAPAIPGGAPGLSAQNVQPNIGPRVQTTNPMQIVPAGPKPDWAPTIDPQMLAVVEQLGAFEQPPLPQMTAFQARNAKTPTEAVTALLMKAGIPPSEPRVDVGHRALPVGPEQGILVRTYTPLSGNGPRPVIVYYHGGGWVIADLDTYEPSARALAEKTGAIVVSVAYRQAPEHRFPTAHEDAFAAYRWVVENAAQLGGDPARIATAGESAGGNLAVAVPLMARERGVRLPVHVLSVYPIADGDTVSASYREYHDAKPLSRPAMAWFFDQYKPDWETTRNPLISLIDADVSGLPATTIINAEIDPLRTEGEELARHLRRAGIPVEQRTFQGVTHEFFGMAALLEQAVQAQDLAVRRLQASFGAPATRGAGMKMAPDGSMRAAPAVRRTEGISVRKDP